MCADLILWRCKTFAMLNVVSKRTQIGAGNLFSHMNDDSAVIYTLARQIAIMSSAAGIL
jgi:hypothetical protein